MRFRKLRIAWSVFCALVFVALIGWSYTRMLSVGHRGLSNYARLYLANGQVQFLWANQEKSSDDNGWFARTYPVPVLPWQYKWRSDESSIYFAVTAWLFAPIPAAIALMPWVVHQFSLRTMIIATTLVAVVLGLVVWAAGK